jgi:chemotaxis protein methyltransferase WspC
MPVTDFESLLKQTVGLDATALGRAVIERAVSDRIAASGLQQWRDYLEHARSTEDELQALLDAVVLPETWFFRDRVAFETLGRLAVQCWLTASHGDYLRLLSVGCGSGEEPYSMVMELLDAGFPAERIRIDAIDISSQALARARQAVYGKESFRGNDLRFSERYFTTGPEGFKLDAKVRQAVTFFRGNVLADTFLSGHCDYDFIFCRNLLFYFDAQTQARVIGALHQALGKQGVAFVSPSEAELLTKPSFVPVEIPGVNAFLKAGKNLVRSATQTARTLRTQVMAPQPDKSGKAPKPQIRSALDLAMRLAERGQWADVRRLCEAYVRDHGESAQALYLLGRARDVEGELEAARGYYGRAIELHPEHTLATLRLAQLPDPKPAGEANPALQSRTPQAKRKLEP